MRFLPNNRGFTLVETLIVIGIIVVLAAILMPAYQGMVNRSAAAKSLAKIKQNTAGLLLLAGFRNGELAMRARGEGSGSAETSFWASQLERFMDFPREAFFCDNVEHGLREGIHSPTHRNAWPFRVSYGVNFTHDGWVASRNEGQFMVKSLRLVNVEKPASTIFMATTMHPNGFGRYALDELGRGVDASLHLRFNNRALVTFFDGSARLLAPEELREHGFTGAYGKTVNDWVPFDHP